MPASFRSPLKLRTSLALTSLVAAICLVFVVFSVFQASAQRTLAAPIPPPEGYPKLSLSTMVVSPTLAPTSGTTLEYHAFLRNTGAYQASGATFEDVLPANVTYAGDAWSSIPPTPTFSNGAIHWQGDVGFDATVEIRFSVNTTAGFEGILTNTAVISHPLIAEPVTVSAETTLTDAPILAITKSSLPTKQGANKPMVYTLEVENQGQPAANLPVTVIDHLPANTSLLEVGPDGSAVGSTIQWTRPVTLDIGETSTFTFSVTVGDVASGTIITNDSYQVSSPETGVSAGEPYTVTVVDPIFLLSKQVFPDPPGSNREMTYTLRLVNKGSLATGIVVTDQVPENVEYRRGGSESNGTVTWNLDRLDTGEVAEFTYTVYVGDVQGVQVLNANYQACSAEGVCKAGTPVENTVMGPDFKLSVALDPIAKKPGGGGGPVTPTLVVENVGPGNALDAHVRLDFTNISVSGNDLFAIPANGTLPPFPPGPLCGEHCVSYLWTGDLAVGEVITFTTIEGQSTIGGEEGNVYTATMIISDSLTSTSTVPVQAYATGIVTHYANPIPTKQAPEVIGRGQLMTYNIEVWNSGLSTEFPPVLTETVPLSVSLVSVGGDGISQTLDGRTVISWTLPQMSPGDRVQRSFQVQVDFDLVSGTQIVNDQYGTAWTSAGVNFTKPGEPVTTTVRDAGLIDSFKVVTPTLALPAPDNLLTYYLHIVNSSDVPLENVQVMDQLPWEHTTYQRDAVASAGTVISDIVSIQWMGDLAPLSSEIITFTALVDPDYEGTITNTAVITHPSLLETTTVQAVAHITTKPFLVIEKAPSVKKIWPGNELVYTLKVTNLGQQATSLVVTDTVPADTQFVSASAGGTLVDGVVQWELPALNPGEQAVLTLRVLVTGGEWIVNDQYGVTCNEGVSATGKPVIVQVSRLRLYLPVIKIRP